MARSSACEGFTVSAGDQPLEIIVFKVCFVVVQDTMRRDECHSSFFMPPPLIGGVLSDAFV